MTSQHQMIEESMSAQRAYLEIVRSRHHQWAYASDDPEIRRLHLKIADSIQQTMDQYYELLQTYHSEAALLSQVRPDIFTFYPASVSNSAEA